MTLSGMTRRGYRKSELLERNFDVRVLLEPARHRQFLRAQEFRIEQLGLVARAGIGEHRDDGLARTQILGEADGARDVDTRRAAEAEPLVLEQVEDDRYRLFVGDQVRLFDLDVLDDRG